MYRYGFSWILPHAFHILHSYVYAIFFIPFDIFWNLIIFPCTAAECIHPDSQSKKKKAKKIEIILPQKNTGWKVMLCVGRVRLKEEKKRFKADGKLTRTCLDKIAQQFESHQGLIFSHQFFIPLSKNCLFLTCSRFDFLK